MSDFQITHLSSSDLEMMHCLLDCFGEAFGERSVYSDARPDEAYLEELLDGKAFFALAAHIDGNVIGGLAAYELRKFEQKRSEIYIYDLAVDEAHRRKGIATKLIEEIQTIAKERGAWVVYVQADQGDTPAINLYSKLGAREEVLHFDIPVEKGRRTVD